MSKPKMKLGWKRLLKLADILDVADEEHRRKGEKTYNQGPLLNDCGTPSCALGHYVSYVKRPGNSLILNDGFCELRIGGELVGVFGEEVQREFCINYDDAHELFDPKGCGAAKTAKQASKYIRKFVARKLKESARA